TALENVVLGVEPHRGPWVDRKAAQRRAQALADDLGVSIPWHTPVRSLSLGVQQWVETLRLLYRNAQILIFDEPTTILTPQEVDSLFAVVRRLAAGGRSVILITHKLREVLNLAQRITVLRQGRVVAVTEAAQATPDALARLMVGEVIAPAVRADPPRPGGDPRRPQRRRGVPQRVDRRKPGGHVFRAAALLAHRTAAHAYDRRARAPRDRALRGARRAPRAGHGQPLRRHHAAP